VVKTTTKITVLKQIYGVSAKSLVFGQVNADLFQGVHGFVHRRHHGNAPYEFIERLEQPIPPLSFLQLFLRL
jgi:hypothetical protein